MIDEVRGHRNPSPPYTGKVGAADSQASSYLKSRSRQTVVQKYYGTTVAIPRNKATRMAKTGALILSASA